MNADWIPISIDLARSSKVLSFACAAGISRHEATGLLMDLWGWTSEQSEGGYHPHLVVANLAQIIGGSVKFWESVERGGWLIQEADGLRIPDSESQPWVTKSAKTRYKARARKRSERVKKSQQCHKDVTRYRDQTSREAVTMKNENDNENDNEIHYDDSSSSLTEISFDESSCAAGVSHLASQLGHQKGECVFLWRVSALVQARALAQSDVADSVEGTKRCAKADRVAYFRSCLAKRLGGKPALNALLARVHLPRGFAKGPPKLAPIAGDLAARLRATEADE